MNDSIVLLCLPPHPALYLAPPGSEGDAGGKVRLPAGQDCSGPLGETVSLLCQCPSSEREELKVWALKLQ